MLNDFVKPAARLRPRPPKSILDPTFVYTKAEHGSPILTAWKREQERKRMEGAK